MQMCPKAVSKAKMTSKFILININVFKIKKKQPKQNHPNPNQ